MKTELRDISCNDERCLWIVSYGWIFFVSIRYSRKDTTLMTSEFFFGYGRFIKGTFPFSVVRGIIITRSVLGVSFTPYLCDQLLVYDT
jgi:hypothetical protein